MTSSHGKVVREKHYFTVRLAVRQPVRHAIFSQTTGRNLTKVAIGLPILGKGVRELVRLSVSHVICIISNKRGDVHLYLYMYEHSFEFYCFMLSNL